MTFLDDCLKGRSQLFMIESSDKIVIDCKTFREILLVINDALDALRLACSYEIFVQALDTYLCSSDTLDDSQIFKASLLLKVWLDIVPDTLAQLVLELDDAREVIVFVLAASQLGGNND